MRLHAFLFTVVLAGLSQGSGSGQRPAGLDFQPWCTVKKGDLNELSGLAASRRSAGLLWAHNDSGDGPNLYGVNKSGKIVATFTVTGADAVDWEDIAAAGQSGGDSVLYIGDIGDNNEDRTNCCVYRVSEPAVAMDGKRQKGRTAVAEKFPFGYPDGARDAEGLAVHPKTGDIYIISKEDSGKSGVYRFPKPLMRDRRCTLEKIGTIVFTNPLRMRGRNVGKLATAADISPDGRRLVVRTYTEGYEFSIPENGDVAAALKGTPKKLMMPWLGQFEALCFSADGRTLFTAAEESPCTIWAARY